MGTFTKKISNLSQFTVLIVHLVEKMLLFNREVRYQIHSGSGLAGSGSTTLTRTIQNIQCFSRML
jgi:hypothetical protein